MCWKSMLLWFIFINFYWFLVNFKPCPKLHPSFHSSKSAPCPCKPPLWPHPISPQKKKRKKRKGEERKQQPSQCGSCTISWCFREHTLYPKQLYWWIFIALSHWFGPGLWLLPHLQYWTLSWSCLGYPAFALCHSNPFALVWQAWPLHTF